MNKREKEVAKAQLAAEQEVLKNLEKQYKSALNEINQKVKLFEYDIKMLDDAFSMEGLDDAARTVLQSQKQSKVYQKQFQEALKGQIGGILDRLHGNNYSTIEEYLKQCYTDGFLGTMYDMHGQGIPMVMPIDQAAAVKAVMTDSKVSEGLYNALGVDVGNLKKAISSEITRGIASGLTYRDIARNISNRTMAPLSRAKTIARTEGHRIHQASTMDAQHRAKEKGADVVKQWDASLDGKTRPTHRKLDGQIREVDEPFEVDGKTAMAPGHFGKPGEDINCRCVSLTRARWALDEDELQTLQERAEYFGLDKAKDFADFKEKYLKSATKPIANSSKSSTIKPDLQFFGSKEKQFGKKVGKHASDYGLDPSSAEDREKFQGIIQDILDNESEQRIGEWRGQPEEVVFHIKGDDVVITDQAGEFITILKGGINNARVKKARNR